MYILYRMLQFDRGLDVAHNAQGKLSDKRAMERFSQHPQLNGNGRQRKAQMLSEEMEGDGGMSGGNRPMSRLVGHGRKKSNSAQREHAREGKLLEETMEAHEAEGRLMGSGGYSGGNHPAYQQGKMFADFYHSQHGDDKSKRMLHGMLKGSGFLDVLGGIAKGIGGLFGLGRGKNSESEQGEMFLKHIGNKHGMVHSKEFLGGVLHGGSWFSLIPALASLVLGKGRPLAGCGFWSDFGDGFKKGFMGVMKPALAVGSLLPGQIGMASKLGTAGINALGMGRNHAFNQRVSQVMERADMGNPHSKSAKSAMRSIKGMGQPNGVPESIGSPSNGGDPSGAVDVGRVANPSNSFQRNTVGMGRRNPVGMGLNRKRVGENSAGEYHGGYGGVNHNNADGELNFGAGGVSGGKKRRAKAGASDARKRRGAEVSRLMREKGMSLGEASKHIKEHGY